MDNEKSTKKKNRRDRMLSVNNLDMSSLNAEQILSKEPSNIPSELSEETKTQQVQSQVDEIKGIMQENIKKVVERGESMEQIESKTNELHESSQQFQKKTTQVKKKMWWKNMKYSILIIVVLLILVMGLTFTVLKAAGIMA